MRCYLRPIQALVPQRREIGRRNDFFGSVFYDLDRVAREAERAFNNIQREGPLNAIYHNLSPNRSYEMPIILNEDGTRTLRLKFDLDGFSAENIKLTIKENVLTVQAKQGEERTGNKSMKCYKDYYYEYKLPKEVDLEKITSKQLQDGTLLIEAQLPKVEAKDEAVTIPIEKN